MPSTGSMTLIGGDDSELLIDLVQLAPREAGRPQFKMKGSGIIAVATGFVQVEIAGQTRGVAARRGVRRR